MSNKKDSKSASHDDDAEVSWLNESPLGEALRKQYQDTVEEPLPEKLRKLIEEIKRKETKR